MAWSLGRILSFFRRRGGQPAEAPAVEKALPASSQPSLQAVRAALGFMGPGWWASDHIEESAHFTGWNYIAIHTKAVMASGAEVAVYLPGRNRVEKSFDPTRASNEQDRSPVPEDHPYVRLLKRPNGRFSGSLFQYLIMQQQGLTGGARVWMVPNQLGLPFELWVIPTALCRPQPPSRIYPEGSYWVSAVGLYTAFMSDVPAALGLGQMAGLTIDARFVRTISYPHPIYLGDCQSPTGAMGVQIDLAEMLDQATHAGLENTARAGMLLSVDSKMTGEYAEKEIARAERRINEYKGGPGNTGKTLILQGMTALRADRPMTELDYVQGRAQCRDNVMAGHQVSPPAAGVVGVSSYAEYVGAVKQTTDLSVQPMLNMTADALTHWLAPHWDRNLTAEFLCRSIADPAELETRLQTDLSAGNVLTVREYRGMRGLEPLGDQRDEAFAGAGAVQAQQQQPGQGAVPQPPASQQSALGGRVPGLDDRAQELVGGLKLGTLRAILRDELQTLLKTRDDSGHEHDAGGLFTGPGGSGSAVTEERSDKPTLEEELVDLAEELETDPSSPGTWRKVARTYKTVRAAVHVVAVRLSGILNSHGSDILPVVEDTARPWFNPAGMRDDPVRAAIGVGTGDAAIIASHVLAKVLTWVKGKRGKAMDTDEQIVAAVLELLTALRDGFGLDEAAAPLPSEDEVREALAKRRAA